MTRNITLRLLPAVISIAASLMAASLAHGQAATTSTVADAKTGSTAFCLFELPSDDPGKRRWVNLGIVQYVEFSRNELKLYYGGGNLGSGHEARFPISNPAQLEETLNRIRQAAANCR